MSCRNTTLLVLFTTDVPTKCLFEEVCRSWRRCCWGDGQNAVERFSWNVNSKIVARAMKEEMDRNLMLLGRRKGTRRTGNDGLCSWRRMTPQGESNSEKESRRHLSRLLSSAAAPRIAATMVSLPSHQISSRHSRRCQSRNIDEPIRSSLADSFRFGCARAF